jgi:hypothetical protein
MPPARKSSRRSSTFKEPAALKKLNQSLTSAQKALGDLKKHASGSDAAAGTRTLYKGLGKFVTDARRDSTKFGSALRKDFEQAAKAAQKAAKTATGSGTSRRSSSTSKRSRSTTSSTKSSGSSSRSRSTGSSTGRGTKRAATSRSSSGRSSSGRSGSGRSTRKSS